MSAPVLTEDIYAFQLSYEKNECVRALVSNEVKLVDMSF